MSWINVYTGHTVQVEDIEDHRREVPEGCYNEIYNALAIDQQRRRIDEPWVTST